VKPFCKFKYLGFSEWWITA